MAGHGILQNGTSSQLAGGFLASSPYYNWAGDLLDKMPSIRSVATFALSTLGIAQTALGVKTQQSRVPHLSGASEVCHSTQLSCHNTTAVQNLCCFNAPGGTLLQTQFWDTNPVAGPSNSWTIHGLWPDNCDGTYAANCDDSRAYTNISAILTASGHTTLLNYMKKYWVSDSGSAESFWEHEWGKHGTCISTLDPDCYTDYKPTEEVPDFFARTVSLFQTLPTYQWLTAAGINPSSSKTYTKSQIEAALSKNHGGQQVYLGCSNGALDEVWYFFNVEGSIQTGKFVATAPVGSTSSCPSTGIKYLPKNNSTKSHRRDTTTTTTAAPAPTGPPFSGKGLLNVVTSGDKAGCIISYGTWHASGTCARFAVTPSESGFTLKSSKGHCAVQDGKLLCGSGVNAEEATTFTADGSTLVWNGQSAFYADAVPSGNDQGTVFTSNEDNAHVVELSIEWQGV